MSKDSPSPRPKPEYLRQVDGLRAIAVGGVMWQHWLWPSLGIGSTFGVKGVWLFFVISGYLITGILLDCRNDQGTSVSRMWSVRQFYVRRFLRIFPLFYVTLAIAALADVPHVREFLGWHVLYATNLLAVHANQHFQPAAHFWSLAVEEQFYLLWPWLIVFIPRRWLLPSILLAMMAGPATRMLATFWWPENTKTDVLMPSCLDALAVGALLAFFRHRDTAQRSGVEGRVALILLCAGLIAWIALNLFERRLAVSHFAALEPASFALIFGWIVSRAARGFPQPMEWLLSNAAVVYLGRISYGIYVIHPFVEAMFDSLIHWTLSTDSPILEVLLRFGVLLATTIALASISWRVLEAPLNGLKRYFPYRPPKERVTQRSGDA